MIIGLRIHTIQSHLRRIVTEKTSQLFVYPYFRQDPIDLHPPSTPPPSASIKHLMQLPNHATPKHSVEVAPPPRAITVGNGTAYRTAHQGCPGCAQGLRGEKQAGVQAGRRSYMQHTALSLPHFPFPASGTALLDMAAVCRPRSGAGARRARRADQTCLLQGEQNTRKTNPATSNHVPIYRFTVLKGNISGRIHRRARPPVPRKLSSPRRRFAAVDAGERITADPCTAFQPQKTLLRLDRVSALITFPSPRRVDPLPLSGQDAPHSPEAWPRRKGFTGRSVLAHARPAPSISPE